MDGRMDEVNGLGKRDIYAERGMPMRETVFELGCERGLGMSRERPKALLPYLVAGWDTCSDLIHL